MAPRRVLLTGFGPFPKVAVNASADLVARVARAARRRFPGVPIHTATLPTEWHRGPAIARAAIGRFDPDVILHFGVSDKAQGFVIEQRAVNSCCALPDARGGVAAHPGIEQGGPKQRTVTVPVAAIMRALQAAGVPAATSKDAGTYLCNAVLYQSLGLARAVPRRVGFIHIPAVDDGPLSREQALRGGLALLDVCLAP